MTSPKGHIAIASTQKRQEISAGVLSVLSLDTALMPNVPTLIKSVSHAIRERATSQLPPQRGHLDGSSGFHLQARFHGSRNGISGLI
jgi:hypothetical protein